MCAILLSINPEHVQNIMSGVKEYEFRKTLCHKNVEKIYIYSTNPIKKVVGEADIDDILIGSPNEIWQETEYAAGIDKIFFDAYYKNKTQAVAYKLGNVIEYDRPKDLSEYGVKSAPQSFQYIYR